jgi:hypothetical protein
MFGEVKVNERFQAPQYVTPSVTPVQHSSDGITTVARVT